MTTNNARGNDFAKSLCEALYKFGSLTDNQLAAVERNVAKAAERKVEREAAALGRCHQDRAGVRHRSREGERVPA